MDVTEFLALKKGYALAMLEQQGALGPRIEREPGARRKGLPIGENADGWMGNSPAQVDNAQYMKGKLMLPVGPAQAYGDGAGRIPRMQNDVLIAELKNEIMQRNRRRY